MSDIFGLHLYYHVFIPDGDLYVSDSNDGDRWLVKLARQYPDATVIVKDRESGKALTGELLLTALLMAKREYLTITLTPPSGETP